MNIKSHKRILGLSLLPATAMLSIVFTALFMIGGTPTGKPQVTLPLIGILTGERMNNLGWTVSSAGDMNGDHYDDVIVAREMLQPWIYFGSSQYSPAPIGPYYPSKDIVLDETTYGCSGYSFFVSKAGDVNRDGYDDAITGSANEGEAYIYLGGPTVDGTPDVTLSVGMKAGVSIGSAGDVNGDGFADVIVGKESCGNTSAAAIIFLGNATMDTTADVIAYGSPASSDACLCFGSSISSAGDVNGDGYDDAVATEAETVYIYFGGAPMDATADVVIHVPGTSADAVPRAMSAGDVNGDGYDDLMIGACSTDTVYIYYGGNPVDTTADVVLNGESSGDWFGHEVNMLGDVNGDGYDDVIIGAPLNDAGGTNAGRAYIYLGGAPMDTTADAVVTGEAARDKFGWSVSLAGDVNADGYDDVIIGAPYSAAGGVEAGRAYIFSLEVLAKKNIDIKPGSGPNPINLASRAVLVVAANYFQKKEKIA